VVLMKTLLKSILPVVALLVLTINGRAVEYVTLNAVSPGVDVSSSSLVEIVAAAPSLNNNNPIHLSFANGSGHDTFWAASLIGCKFTGLSRVDVVRYNDYDKLGVLSLKITPANEINAVAPSSVFVIPENSTGDFDVLLETSSDMGTWSPFLSQTVSAADAKRFFRARIVKKN
jgi:hypothetical protein